MAGFNVLSIAVVQGVHLKFVYQLLELTVN